MNIKEKFCKHFYIEWSDGVLLLEPYCNKCGKKMPKREYHPFTIMANKKHLDKER
jgi:hypothetical protein